VGFADPNSVELIDRAASRAIASPPRIVAYPLPGLPDRPHVVAEFAGELVLERRNGRLVPARPGTRLPFRDRANLQWIYWGELLAATGGHLAVGPLAVGPWPGAVGHLEPTATPFAGTTSDVLRTLKPAQIIRDAVTAIRMLDERHSFLADRYGWPEPPEQRHLLDQTTERLRRPHRRRGRKYPDSHYRTVALLYLDLLDQGGHRTILIRLAAQLDIPRATARDWVHRARELEYLTRSRQGRPGAQPGPRLQHG
jgi:hypothetical protein